ncbi:hypothetical protein [Lentibacillus populi]|nr:hypothetical protein [Lentibacillus populi]
MEKLAQMDGDIQGPETGYRGEEAGAKPFAVQKNMKVRIFF